MTGARRTALRLVIAPFLTAKVISFVVPVIVVWAQSASPGHPGADEVSAAFNQWDSQSYVQIATEGYPATTTDAHTVYLDAFLPGYPLLMRGVSLLTFGHTVLSGLLISAVAEAVALYYIARLVMMERDEESARFAIWAFALWPMAFFLSAVYTESTFVACAAAALYHARRGNTTVACLMAAASCSIRVTGVALIPAIALEMALRTRFRPGRGWLALVVVPLPLITYGLYMAVHAHNAFAFFAAQNSPSFSHHLALPWTGMLATLASVTSGGPASNTFVFGLELVFAAAGGALCAACCLYRRFPASLAAYCAAVWLLATSLSFWLSIPRYELAMFPALIVLADLTRGRDELRTAVIGVGGALMAVGATLYARGMWLG